MFIYFSKMLKFTFSVYLFIGLAGAVTSENEILPVPSFFMYAIFKDQLPVCAGALVEVSLTTILIVTAAHCVYGIQTSRLNVMFKNARFDQKKALPVHQAIVHPYYMPPSRDYDIALLKIKLQKNNNRQSKLNLIKTEPSSKDSISSVNWDLKAERNSLKIVNGFAEDRKSCRTKLANYTNVSSKMLCANIQSDTVPDGGPLLFSSGIVGVASRNIKDDKKNLPKIFTNVANSEIYSFIQKYILNL